MIGRTWSMVIRHLYVYRRSPIRVFEIVFWPMMDLLIWGYLSVYLSQMALPKHVSFLIGGTILWDILFRSQQAVTVSVLQEMWSRNILNLFVSPLRAWELISATCVVGVLRAMLTGGILAALAIWLYSFNLFTLGIPLALFFVSLLVFGWALGIFTTVMILRFGEAAEGLAWAIPFLLQPFIAVFYPVSTLPGWVQYFSYCIPATYSFEGMREVLQQGTVNWQMLGLSLLLDLLYLALASLLLRWMLGKLREQGYLTRAGRD